MRAKRIQAFVNANITFIPTIGDASNFSLLLASIVFIYSNPEDVSFNSAIIAASTQIYSFRVMNSSDWLDNRLDSATRSPFVSRTK